MRPGLLVDQVLVQEPRRRDVLQHDQLLRARFALAGFDRDSRGARDDEFARLHREEVVGLAVLDHEPVLGIAVRGVVACARGGAERERGHGEPSCRSSCETRHLQGGCTVGTRHPGHGSHGLPRGPGRPGHSGGQGLPGSEAVGAARTTARGGSAIPGNRPRPRAGPARPRRNLARAPSRRARSRIR